MDITIILPAYNEETTIEKTLKSAKGADIIVVDAGSTDNTVRIAKKYKAKVIKSKKRNRAFQQNLGAKYAKGEYLLFLHADCVLPKNWKKCIKGNWGGFFISFQSNHPFFRLVEFRSNWMRVMRTKIFFGDQGIFVKKDLFKKIKGFPLEPILEDILLSKKLRKIAAPTIIKEPIISSPRRFLHHGKYKIYFAMFVVMVMYHLRFSCKIIKKTYQKLQ